jgi:2-succinyl-6-hydroxy-2,4-cyclohexadiene-1-carboxylate synthase
MSTTELAYLYHRAPAKRPTLLLLHGFTGNALGWGEHLEVLARNYGVVAPDAPGHGRSPSANDPVSYSFENTTAALKNLLDNLDLPQVIVLGYSMGGRMALHFALHHPARVADLILESASPGIEDEHERKLRHESDEILATLIEQDGIEKFVEHWENIPLFASQKQLPPEKQAQLHAQRLQNNPQGLANSLRGAGAGVMPPLWDRLGELKMPTLLIAGELDSKYVELSQRIHSLVAGSRLEIVAGAGHTVHLEKPEFFSRIVLNFLTAKGF